MASQNTWRMDIGANPVDSDQVHFRVWAPHAKSVNLKVCTPQPKDVLLDRDELGYFEATVSGVSAGTRYSYLLDNTHERPDPASRFQPDGVHQPSAVIDPNSFSWTDHAWRGLPQKDFIIYELHPGTFSKEGTFRGIIPYLDYLKNDVGITAIELMPVAQFPGTRNWGYDGTYLYAVQNTYGGPEALKQLVDACHAKGLAVIMDVVYNHLGPEGNYLGDFGPYFSDRYRTPWGLAVNYDGPDSDEVRHYIISNAVYWTSEYHIDALRLDAIHGIFDFSAYHVLQELTESVHAEATRLGRTASVIAESDLNNVRFITPTAQGGYGLDGTWNDDFHHALHCLVTGERRGYYMDFGSLEDLATALRDGYVIAGKRSRYRRCRHGNASKGRPPSQFVVFAQNHDQTGNRAIGDRLSILAPEALKVVAATVLLSPNIPLLFMGEEYGETAPFQYFIDHGDQDLVEAVRKGRRAEFAHFGWKPEDIPDPQDPATFERSRIHPGQQSDPHRAAMLRWTRSLTRLRRSHSAFAAADSDQFSHRVWTFETENIVVMHRRGPSESEGLLVLSFNNRPVSIKLGRPEGQWQLVLSSNTEEFQTKPADAPCAKLSITTTGALVPLPAYGVAVYVTEAGA